MSERRTGWVKAIIVLTCLYGALLLAMGVSWVWGFWKYRQDHHDWQEVTILVVLLTFLPAALTGLKRPKISAWWFFALTVLCVVQALGVTGRTGDGMAAAAVGMVGMIGLPALVAGLLFLRCSKAHSQQDPGKRWLL